MENQDRAARAEGALSQYEDDIKTNIVDLMSDLLHLARQEGMDPSSLLRIANMHFEAEEAEAND